MGSLIQVLNHRSWFDYSGVLLCVLLFAFFHPGEPQILCTMVCLCRYPMRGRHSNESFLVCRFYLIWLEFMFFCALFANLPDERTNSASFFTSRHHLFNPKTTNVCAVFLLTLFSRFPFCTSFCFDKIQQSWRPLNFLYRFFFIIVVVVVIFFPFDVMCWSCLCRLCWQPNEKWFNELSWTNELSLTIMYHTLKDVYLRSEYTISFVNLFLIRWSFW